MTGPAEILSTFEIRYQRQRSIERLHSAGWLGLFVVIVAGASYLADVNLQRLAEGVPAIEQYVRGLLPNIHSVSIPRDLSNWYWGFPKWMSLLWETILMAFLGTLFGATGALVLSFPASQNFGRNRWIREISKRVLEAMRTIPELVFALLFVYAFGLGPMAGVLAIATHSMGSLGKMFSELNDNVPEQSLRGVSAAGANWLELVRFGPIPQVLPDLVSYSLLRFETNVRASSIIGFVGVGGIGQELYVAVRQFQYQDVSAIVLLIVAVVAIIDVTCEYLRRRFIAGSGK